MSNSRCNVFLIDYYELYGYNPDFDSIRRQKEAANLDNKGVAALTYFHKYVG